MKRFIFLLLLSFVTVSSFAQFNVYARMHGIYYGKPQKVVIETTGEVITFDREGRIKSNSMGDNEIRYTWNGNKITLTAYQNGKKLGEEYMTVTSNTTSEIVVSMPNGTLRETYRSNGTHEKSVLTSNGQSIIETSFYKTSSDKSRYKFTVSAQGQTDTYEVSNCQTDSKGNWIRMTSKLNGQSETEIRNITYYQ